MILRNWKNRPKFLVSFKNMCVVAKGNLVPLRPGDEGGKSDLRSSYFSPEIGISVQVKSLFCDIFGFIYDVRRK